MQDLTIDPAVAGRTATAQRDSDRTTADRHLARRRWYALAVLCTAFFMGVLDSTSVYTALPTIATDLGFSAAGVQWVITAYGVTVGGFLLLGGRVADLVGRRRAFMAGVALFAAGSLLGGLAWSSEVLLAARVAQGLGAGAMTPAGLSLVMTIFPEGPDRNRALGIWGGLGGIGATVGLLLGGVLTDWLGWEWIFLMNVPACVAVLGLSPTLLPESRERRRPKTFDAAGAITVTGALTLALLALFRAAEVGWQAGSTLALFAAAAGLGALFVGVEFRSAAPLVPLRVFRSRTLVGGNLVILVAGLSVDGLLIIVTLYAQQILGYSAIQFGFTTAIMTVTSVAGVMLGQHYVTRVGFRTVAVVGMTLLAVSCLVLAQVSVDGSLVGDLLSGLVLFGAGMGAAFVAAQIAALSGVASDDSGVAAGIEETSFAVGTTLGVAIASAVAVAHSNHLLETGMADMAAQTEGFRMAFLTAAGFAVLGLVAALTLLRPPGRPSELPSGPDDINHVVEQ